MKIRDINKYVESYCPGSENLEMDFLHKAFNDSATIEQLLAAFSRVASNAHEQIFYEFVQNADDACADTLSYYWNENYLVVLNNGKTFHTSITQEKKKAIKGQLFSFLALNQSDKFGDGYSGGEFGQGSKLLYSLMADVTKGKDRDQLVHDVIDNGRGPILLSWAKDHQLYDLLLGRNEWVYADPENEEDHMLVTKIVNGYFPVMPGTDDRRFSHEELSNALEAFDKLVQPKRHLNDVRQGTALIIPLGKGKSSCIGSERNISNLRSCIANFVSVRMAEDVNRNASLKVIHVPNERLEPLPVDTLSFDFEEEGVTYDFRFAFNPAFAKQDSVNLFSNLPVLDSHYRLGFLIDSRLFEVDGARQHFTDVNKVKLHLQIAFEHLIKELELLKEKDKEKFLRICKSILASDVTNCQGAEFIVEPFRNVFGDFFKNHVISSNGEVVCLDSAIIPSSKDMPMYPLHKLGVDGLSWTDSDCANSLLRLFDIEVSVYSFRDLILEAKKDDLSAWLLSLDVRDYLDVHTRLAELWDDPAFDSFSLYRTNHDNLVSKDDLVSKGATFYYDDANLTAKSFAMFPELDVVLAALPSGTAYYDTVYSKLKNNIGLFTQKNSGKECACTIIAALIKMNPFIKDNSPLKTIAVLTNRLDECKPFSQLLPSSLSSEVYCRPYCIGGYRPEAMDEKWMPNTASEKRNWVKEWVEENQLDGVDSFSGDEIRMINALYPDWLSFYYVVEEDGSFVLKELGVNESNFVPVDNLAQGGVDEVFVNAGHHPIPADILSIADMDKYPHNATDLVKSVIESRAYCKPLYPLVQSCDDSVKRAFINTITIELNAIDSREAIDWKILMMFAHDAVYRDLLFRRICFCGNAIPLQIISEKVSCNNRDYSIYDLDTQAAISNSKVSAISKKLGLELWTDFCKYYYAGKQLSMHIDELYSRLSCLSSLSLPQLLFCIDYSETHSIQKKHVLSASVQPKEVLHELKNRNQVGFDRFWALPGYNHVQQYYTEIPQLLLDKEMLPEYLQTWAKDPAARSLMSMLRETNNNKLFMLRQHLLDGTAFKPADNRSLLKTDSELLRNTLAWISVTASKCGFEDENFKYLSDICSLLSPAIMPCYMLRFTGEVIQVTNPDTGKKSSRAELAFEPISATSAFYINKEDAKLLADRICSKVGEDVRGIVKGNKLYLVPSTNYMAQHKLNTEMLWTVEDTASANNSSYFEWDHQVYRKWRDETGLQIYISPSPVVTTFNITSGDKVLLRGNSVTTRFGAKKNEFVVIQHQGNDSLPILKTIETILTDEGKNNRLTWFNQHFVRLQGMFIDYLEENNGEGGNVQVPEEKKDSIRELSDFFDEETLASMASQKERLLDLLKKEQEEKEAQINPISGCIGEQLYLYYQKARGKEPEYSAAKGIGAYDFDLDGVVIDVKTNVGTLKDGSAPLHIHRSTQLYLREHPEAEFKLFRISLEDLGLADAYRRLREIHKGEVLPEYLYGTQVALECEELAEKYWGNHTIQEFEDNTLEYLVRIPVRLNK